jgi:glycosyltransferase involved in cell wall biosynthesis
MQTLPGRALKIVTNHWGQKISPSWRSHTTYIAPTGTGLFASFALAAKLCFKQADFDCVVLGAGRSDLLFALMRLIAPFPRKPCVMIDCLWYRHENDLNHFLKKLVLNIAAVSVDTFVVWASREIGAYSRAFGLPKEKFVFIPYHTTLDAFNVQPAEEDYIFSGGNFGRDYQTLVEAVRGLPIKVFIASTRPELFSHISLPANVDVRGYSHEGFLKMMAGCRINIVSLDAGLLHSGGQQTFLNSMRLGKPTIVNDPDGAADYITDGEDGLLVPPKNPEALRAAITSLLNDPLKAKHLGSNAMAKARNFNTDEHFKKIIEVAEDAVKAKARLRVKPAARIGVK